MAAATITRLRSGNLTATALRGWAADHAEVLLVAGILAVAAIAHGVNMFNFPYYEDDEGTYVSQAWAVIQQGQLAPYTYWYDHAPLGWILISGWLALVGGIHAFGTAIETGRVLMLILQVASTFMVYRITRRVSGRVGAAVVASLAFALSAYGIYYHRRVLLDNVATFWMLLSILLLVESRLSLKRVWLSAVALGVSILSKELTIFLVPVLAYLVYVRVHPSQRWFAVIGWLALVGSVFSGYVLMAVLKSELFPTGTLLGGTAPHVSLLGSLQSQMARGKDGGVLDLSSGFWRNARLWMRDEPLLVVGGTLAAFGSAALIGWRRLVGVLGLATLSLGLFLARGGEVIGFYLVPLLPLLAINLGLLLGLLQDTLTGVVGLIDFPRPVGVLVSRALILVLLAAALSGIGGGYTDPNRSLADNPLLFWTGSEAVAQRQALDWTESHLAPGSKLIVDMYMWADLHDRPGGEPAFQAAHYYWKVDFDPEIQVGAFGRDWRTVDYVIATPQMHYDADHVTGMDIVATALEHSTLVARFDTGGWPIEVRAIEGRDQMSGP